MFYKVIALLTDLFPKKNLIEDFIFSFERASLDQTYTQKPGMSISGYDFLPGHHTTLFSLPDCNDLLITNNGEGEELLRIVRRNIDAPIFLFKNYDALLTAGFFIRGAGDDHLLYWQDEYIGKIHNCSGKSNQEVVVGQNREILIVIMEARYKSPPASVG
jgi:hypothetical protein